MVNCVISEVILLKPVGRDEVMFIEFAVNLSLR